MAGKRGEFPDRETSLPVQGEYAAPCEKIEFGDPLKSEYQPPAETAEFDPPGSQRVELEPSRSKRKKLKRFAYLVLSALLVFSMRGTASLDEAALRPMVPPELTPAAISAEPEPTEVVEKTPEPVVYDTKEPDIKIVFYYFSHEHHGYMLMNNMDAAHSICVSVRETVLDERVWEKYLDEGEMHSGRFDLPVLSTGDMYEKFREEYEKLGRWPKFEMLVTIWYENEAGDGEDEKTYEVEPEWELGIGFSYWKPSYTWSEQIAPDSFVIMPWDDTEDVVFVLNDPSAVTDPHIISFDMSYNGRHITPDEYKEVVVIDEYDAYIGDATETTHIINHTKEIMIPRPDWIPESGTVHVTTVQMLSCTGELFTREEDYEYTPESEW